MDKKLEQWLHEQELIRARKRDEHLIELGLIDESRSYKNTTYSSPGGKTLNEAEVKEYREKGLRVVEDTETHYEPIQVSEEEYELICRYSPEGNTSTTNETSEIEYLMSIAKSTKTVSTIMIVYVILSIILGLIYGIVVWTAI